MLQAEFEAQGEGSQHSEGHQTQAAKLDQRQNHELPEEGVLAAGIDNDQTGNGNR